MTSLIPDEKVMHSRRNAHEVQHDEDNALLSEEWYYSNDVTPLIQECTQFERGSLATVGLFLFALLAKRP